MQFKTMVIDLYRVGQRGTAWKRIERSERRSERLLQEALQTEGNQKPLGLGGQRVRWIGREFKSADFFGIDAKWNIVFVETKVSSQQRHLAQQLKRRVGPFVGMEFKKVDELVWNYISGGTKSDYLMAEGLRLRRLYERGKLLGPKDVHAELKKRIRAPRRRRVPCVRFVAVSPRLSHRFAEALQKLQWNLKHRTGMRTGRLLFSCVLVTPYLERGQDIAVAHVHL